MVDQGDDASAPLLIRASIKEKSKSDPTHGSTVPDLNLSGEFPTEGLLEKFSSHNLFKANKFKPEKSDVEHGEALSYTTGVEGLTVRAVLVGSAISAVLAMMIYYAGGCPLCNATSLRLTHLRCMFSQFFMHLAEGPGGNYTTSLLGFIILKAWTRTAAKYTADVLEFGVAENLLVQTIATGGGQVPYASGLAAQFVMFKCDVVKGVDITNDKEWDCYDPSPKEIFAWTYVFCLYGVFLSVPLYIQFIKKDKLPFPDGQAIAQMLKALHAPEGSEVGTRQLGLLSRFFAWSSIFMFVKWGWGLLADFPVFGYKASQYYWYMDIDTAQIAYGILVPKRIVVTLLVGTVVGWGLIGPFVQNNRASDWYDNFTDSGFKDQYQQVTSDFVRNVGVFIILVDGMYELVRITSLFIKDKCFGNNRHVESDHGNDKALEVPWQWWVGGTVAIFAIIVGVVPNIFPEEVSGVANSGITIGYAQVAVAAILSPIVAVGIVYGAGLTNQLAGSAAGKLGILIFQLWAGKGSSVLGPMALGSVATNVVGMAGAVMTDFKAAYLLGVSRRVMFVGQVIGSLVGAAVTAGAFFFFTANPLPSSQFPLVYGIGFRQIAVSFSEGVQPESEWFIIGFSIATLLSNVVRDVLATLYPKHKIAEYWPSMICIGLGFYLPPSFQLIMGIGMMIRWYWTSSNPVGFKRDYASVSAGMIAASGIMGVVTSMITFIPGTPWITTTYSSG